MFHATVALRSVLQIQPGLLRQYGIRGLMLDLDNTLTTHDNPAPAEGVLSWIGVMRQAGIAMMIVALLCSHGAELTAKGGENGSIDNADVV